jgi:hypothetical protein
VGPGIANSVPREVSARRLVGGPYLARSILARQWAAQSPLPAQATAFSAPPARSGRGWLKRWVRRSVPRPDVAQLHGKPKALPILAHKLARAVYHMLLRERAFDAARFFPLTTTPEPPVRSDVEAAAPRDQLAGRPRRGAKRPRHVANTANPPEGVVTAPADH